MVNVKGCLYILFVYLGWKITEPVSHLWSAPFFDFEVGLHIALTLLTTAALTKVFLILYPNTRQKTGRFLFFTLDVWVYISLFLSVIIGIIWLFIK